MDIRNLPLFRPILEARYRRRFRSARGMGAWYGEFSTFEAAVAAAPAGAPIGYDTEGTETLYDNFFRVDAKDFPVLFWLEKLLQPGHRVFDFGGHVGHTCLAYRQLLTRGPAITWEVFDVASVVAEGNRRVAANDLERLLFTTDFARASGADVLHAAGSLQYAPRSLPEMLEELPVKPRHIVVNMLPTLSDTETVTLQNIGPAFCPYRIQPRPKLPDGLRTLGYEQLAAWENPEGRTRVPFNSRARKITWVGYCFRLATT